MNIQNLSAEFLQECRSVLHAEQTKSLAETANWSHVDKQQIHLDWDALYKILAPMVQNSLPSSPEIQSVMARHYAIASRFYVPSKKAYIGMGLYYQENPDMNAFHNAYHPDMAQFLSEAICIYAHHNL